MQLHPFPEPDTPELEPYTLYGRPEIVSLLRRITGDRTLVTVYPGRAGDFSVSMILETDPDRGRLVLDMPAGQEARQRVLQARELVFVAFFENIKLQFTAGDPRERAFDGKPAFEVVLPERMLRLQRRESFRVRTPRLAPASCLIPQADGASRYESVRVVNLSVGGLAVLVHPHLFDLPPGGVVRNCFLDLPGVGPINVAFRVVNVYDIGGGEGEWGRRCGCQFLELDPQARMMLQRYVNRVEAEQRKVAVETKRE